MSKYILITTAVCFFIPGLQAQKGVEVGAWLGLSHYYGDLQTEIAISDPGIAGGLNFRYNFNDRICFKTSLNYGRLSANDEDSQNTFERQRNLNFASDIFDFTGQLEFNFLPYIHGSKEYNFTPYLLAGMSTFSFGPTTTLNGTKYELRDFGTEGQPINQEYGRFSIAPVVGMGIKWDINVDWSFNIEMSFHSSQTDYLDDVSGVYPDFNALLAERGPTAVQLSDRSIGGGIGEPGRQRGNSRNNDAYVFFGLSIMRYFGSIDCPKVTAKRKQSF